MAKRFSGLKSFGSKAVSVAASAALALSLTPAIALANAADLQAQSADLSAQHYAPVNNTGYALADSNEKDPLSGGVVQVTKASELGKGVALVHELGTANSYVYKGYAHSDGSHYSMYSLYTEITTDANGMLTGINLTSGVDTFASRWGGLGSQVVVDGYLPDGVTFADNQSTDSSKNTTIEPTLKGADALGYTLTGIYLYNVKDDLSVVGFDEETTAKGQTTTVHRDYDASPGAASADTDTYSYDKDTNTLVVKNGSYNLVKVAYKIGYETTFNAYVIVNDSDFADQYLDKNVPATDYSPTNKNLAYTANRDRWSHIMLSNVLQRQLQSWGATLADEKAYTGTYAGELGGIDTVSGATKTSVPFVAALEAAAEAGYVKGVAETVAGTIDGSDIDVAAEPKDQSTVTTNSAGQYVLSNVFPYNDELKRNDTHGVSFDSVAAYDLSGKTVRTYGMDALAKGKYSSASPLATYAAADTGAYEVTSRGATTKAWAPADAEVGKYYTNEAADGSISIDYEVRDAPIVVTVKNPAITHLVLSYTLGHATYSVAYDLAAMKAAGDVQASIAAAGTTASKVAAARAAYDALGNDVKGFVTNYSTLVKAESAVAAKTVKKGDTKTVSSQSYKVTKVATSKSNGTVTFTKAKNAASATVPASVKLSDGKTYTVTKIAAKAFKSSKATKVTVKATGLTKANVKNCFKGSKVASVKVPAKKLTAYKKIFTKANTGSAKALKVTK